MVEAQLTQSKLKNIKTKQKKEVLNAKLVEDLLENERRGKS